jgi:hypothetical protein
VATGLARVVGRVLDGSARRRETKREEEEEDRWRHLPEMTQAL